MARMTLRRSVSSLTALTIARCLLTVLGDALFAAAGAATYPEDPQTIEILGTPVQTARGVKTFSLPPRAVAVARDVGSVALQRPVRDQTVRSGQRGRDPSLKTVVLCLGDGQDGAVPR